MLTCAPQRRNEMKNYIFICCTREETNDRLEEESVCNCRVSLVIFPVFAANSKEVEKKKSGEGRRRGAH